MTLNQTQARHKNKNDSFQPQELPCFVFFFLSLSDSRDHLKTEVPTRQLSCFWQQKQCFCAQVNNARIVSVCATVTAFGWTSEGLFKVKGGLAWHLFVYTFILVGFCFGSNYQQDPLKPSTSVLTRTLRVNVSITFFWAV